jgi:GNAT superfamily N-acetyltransferase
LEPSGVIRIREYRAADRPKLESMYGTFEPRGAAEGLPPVRTEKAFRWLVHLGEHTHSLVAFSDSAETQIAGHVILAPGVDGEVELALFVHQDFRGRGVGLALARAAVEAARRRGYRRIWLTVSPGNKPALRVYENCGFRVTPGRSSRDGEMELRLD